MLDAAHGESSSPISGVHRVHVARSVIQVTRVVIACGVRRSRPEKAPRADIRQGSRRVVAVARSRYS